MYRPPHRVGLPILLALAVLAPLASAGAQRPSRAPAPPATVDANGVFRWADGREVALFGVNYAAPFAFDYRATRALGLDAHEQIDADVAHLARLGVDAYRIHVWDREVSDSAGNLLQNEHLDLFDYLLSKLAERGIKVILTPIAWWGPGYPEPDLPSPGFSNGHSKPQMFVDPLVRRAQVRYLAQFIAHENPYTRRTYRDDPDIIAIEVFNEPWHDLQAPPEITRYINEMVASLRGAGLRKPIFYNISEHWTAERGQAVCAANVQGVTAQWYPTGLVRGEALPGNPLPNVDRYTVPWSDTPGCATKARMVYEFDGADVTVPVMYPAMARAFRGAGFQWATQFAYDPLADAWSNTEYQTHYLNLVYTPAKAISFLIAGEVFRRTPRGFDAGMYPRSERFGAFRLSYAERLSELLTDTLFAYTGHTPTDVPSPGTLRHVAGVGNSAVVNYGGTGAYFLDRLADGVWRLEVYPDAIPVRDPHSRGSLQRTVTRLESRARPMRIALPDLGEGFTARALNSPNRFQPPVDRAAMTVRPGVYLLARAGVATEAFTPDRRMGGRAIGEFFLPAEPDGIDRGPIVRHEPPPSVAAGRAFDVRVQVAGPAPDSVLLYARYVGWQGYRRPMRMTSVDAYDYIARVAADSGRTGILEYVATVFGRDGITTYPAAASGVPTAWDYTGTAAWSTRVVPADAPLVLFDADRDRSRVVAPGYIPGAQTRSEWIAGSQPERGAWLAGVDAFGATAQHAAFRTMLRDGTRARVASEATGDAPAMSVRVRARAQGTTAVPVEIALILADGSAWGTTLAVPTAWSDIDIPLRDLKRVPLVLIPRPYPSFLPYDLTVGTSATAIDLKALEGVQWGFARAPGSANDAAMRVELESVQLVMPPRR